MKHIFIRLRSSAEIAVWTLLLGGLCAAATWTESAAQLAGAIEQATGPTTIHLATRNTSSLSSSQFQEFVHELEAALRARGIRLVTSNSGVEVAVTASENVRGYVFIALAQVGRETKTAVIGTAKSLSSGTQPGGAAVTLKKSLLIEQDEPVLDILLLDGGAQMVVLGTSRASLYKRNGEQWQAQSAFEIQHARPTSLDPRGRLVPATDHAFDAYLPGMVCASQTLTPLVMSCRASDDPWPIGEKQAAFFNASRNYFSGVISPGIGGASEPFYSAIPLVRPNGTAWVLNTVDGHARVSDGKDTVNLRANSAARDWGSDIAALNGCGRGSLVVASGAGDSTMPDTLRAYEMPDREPMAASTPLDMPGPVMALWPQPDRMSAVAVVRSLTTGKYDAYAVSATCNQ